jgi:hypothetical protein
VVGRISSMNKNTHLIGLGRFSFFTCLCLPRHARLCRLPPSSYRLSSIAYRLSLLITPVELQSWQLRIQTGHLLVHTLPSISGLEHNHALNKQDEEDTVTMFHPWLQGMPRCEGNGSSVFDLGPYRAMIIPSAASLSIFELW